MYTRKQLEALSKTDLNTMGAQEFNLRGCPQVSKTDLISLILGLQSDRQRRRDPHACNQCERLIDTLKHLTNTARALDINSSDLQSALRLADALLKEVA